jgi:uncharacterized protein involved in exopolysaccharide biosynthesis
MSPYRRTFMKYRRLLLMPVVLAVGLALWTVGGAPKSYRSITSLWVDYPPPAPSSLTVTDPSMRTPADQHKLIFDELMQTRDFRVAVARRGPLARYLQAGPAKGWGPIALLSSLRGSGGAPTDATIAAAFGPKQVTSVVAGPQVLQLTYRAGDPVVAAETLRALVNQYDVQLTKIGTERTRSMLSYQQARVDAASKAVTEARGRLGRYEQRNPGAAPASDPDLRALTRAQRSAGSELSSATAALNRAASDLQPAQPAETGVRVIDAPRLPHGPLRGNTMLVVAMIGGLFVGGLVSLLGLIALTPSRPSGWDGHAVDEPPAEVVPFDVDGFLSPKATDGAAVRARGGLRGVSADVPPQRARVGGKLS